VTVQTCTLRSDIGFQHNSRLPLDGGCCTRCQSSPHHAVTQYKEYLAQHYQGQHQPPAMEAVMPPHPPPLAAAATAPNRAALLVRCTTPAEDAGSALQQAKTMQQHAGEPDANRHSQKGQSSCQWCLTWCSRDITLGVDYRHPLSSHLGDPAHVLCCRSYKLTKRALHAVDCAIGQCILAPCVLHIHSHPPRCCCSCRNCCVLLLLLGGRYHPQLYSGGEVAKVGDAC
jgi:hypothetical protein